MNCARQTSSKTINFQSQNAIWFHCLHCFVDHFLSNKAVCKNGWSIITNAIRFNDMQMWWQNAMHRSDRICVIHANDYYLASLWRWLINLDTNWRQFIQIYNFFSSISKIDCKIEYTFSNSSSMATIYSANVTQHQVQQGLPTKNIGFWF